MKSAQCITTSSTWDDKTTNLASWLHNPANTTNCNDGFTTHVQR